MNEVLPVPHTPNSLLRCTSKRTKLLQIDGSAPVSLRDPPTTALPTYSAADAKRQPPPPHVRTPILLSLSHPVPTLPPSLLRRLCRQRGWRGFFVHALFSVCFAQACVCVAKAAMQVSILHILFAARAGGDSPCLPVVMHYKGQYLSLSLTSYMRKPSRVLCFWYTQKKQ